MSGFFLFSVFKVFLCHNLNWYFLLGGDNILLMDMLHLFTHLLLDRHLDCSLFLAIMHNATMNIDIQIFPCFQFCPIMYLVIELQHNMVTMFSKLSNCQTVFKVTTLFYISAGNV